jgi:hypothetical protein
MTQPIQSGSNNKAGETLTVTFPVAYDQIPVVVISQFWDGGGGLGDPGVITEITNTNFTVTSGNMNINYFINWIAMPKT